MKSEPVSVLRLHLAGRPFGHLAGYRGGRNVLVFDESWRSDPDRETLTLTAGAGFPRAEAVLAKPWMRQQRLHPWLSNLLPEGALRDWLAQSLKVHPDNEFPLLAQLGGDLPGAVMAEPMLPEDVPAHVLDYRTSIVPIVNASRTGAGFSLAGVQMKFSVREREGRFHFGHANELGDWIVKTPSTRHRGVPANEYATMRLAQAAGIEIPEIRLIPLSQLDAVPDIALPDASLFDEQQVYAIKRYDRADGRRIHVEDMAQVLFCYPQQKYEQANYEQLGRILRGYAKDGLSAVQALACRLLVNILLGNGDAHLKNWSLIYRDGRAPELSPAYDILFTQAWLRDEQEIALNLNGSKRWYELGWQDFQGWSQAVGTPWPAVRAALEATMERARDRWPRLLAESPMLDTHQRFLREHWARLSPEWRIE
ncbi:type II toxin-antitoxin system HipA family toxin [Salinicola rhizosphaerae]|uniref:Phosphatidylinositol kinase n=1 Tax=Salinicola rhizosphaerae TaxID=1443141 RepID=A0ABQ3DS13_9GAMM|nr:type II toxin-antitoxin system HipA family toxin [Salinicola rhizosphaerae]GHB07025.1 phosphatidylinositol kinase [Salinicola rhizosphaerae]